MKILVTGANGFMGHGIIKELLENGIFIQNYYPIIILQLISLFFLFKKIKFSSKIINFISCGCFNIYLISDYPGIREYLIKKVYIYGKFSIVEHFSYSLYCFLRIFVFRNYYKQNKLFFYVYFNK